MVTEQKIHRRLTFGYNFPVAEERFYYIVTAGQEVEEDVVPLLSTPAGSVGLEIWGTTCKHLRFPQEQILEIMIKKEIDVDDLQTAISATDEEVNQWLALLLEDYDIDSSEENIEVASLLIRSWLEQQALRSGLKLEKDELSKLFQFAVRLAYEALYVGSISI